MLVQKLACVHLCVRVGLRWCTRVFSDFAWEDIRDDFLRANFYAALSFVSVCVCVYMRALPCTLLVTGYLIAYVRCVYLSGRGREEEGYISPL